MIASLFRVLLLLVVVTPAIAQTGTIKTKPQLSNEINANLPTNTSGLITPLIVRQTLVDILSSTITTISSTVAAGASIAANLPDNTTGLITSANLRQALLGIVNIMALLPTTSQSQLTNEINTSLSGSITADVTRQVLQDMVAGMQVPGTEPCDLVTCAEAWSVTRGMLSSYNGPLFQITNGTTSGSPTLNIGMAPSRTVDMTTWSAFCSGTDTNCKITRIYAQVHGTPNDFVAMNYDSIGFYGCTTTTPCYAKFHIETATGVPILEAGCDTVGGNGGSNGCASNPLPGKYSTNTGTIDSALTGVNTSGPTTVLYNGQFSPIAANHCCGGWGIGHFFTSSEPDGSTFTISYNFGNTNSNGGANCNTSTNYCFVLDSNSPNIVDITATAINIVVVFDHGGPPNSLIDAYYNGHTVASGAVPFAPYNVPGPFGRLGGGGDMSQPAPVLWREGVMTNSVLSSAQLNAILGNEKGFYPTLSFP